MISLLKQWRRRSMAGNAQEAEEGRLRVAEK
jgi:hypothetical protein